mgnify:CR=1 FL=1
MTNEEILQEIEKLKKSPYVKIAKEEQALKQKLYQLRWLEKKGKKLAKEQEVKVD